jgi:hypothetical protein
MAVSSGDVHRYLFLVVLLAQAVVVFTIMVWAIKRGMPFVAAASCWLASPLPMAFIAVFMEHRTFSEVVSLRTGSWAFLLGDCVFLPFMAAMLALGWRRLDQEQSHWYTSWWWMAGMAAFGLAAGLFFHFYLDSVNYDTLQLNSPTKLYHDLVAYVVLAGGLSFGLWPVLANAGSRVPFGWLALVLGFGLWLAAGIADNTFHKLDGRDLHIQYDWAQMTPISSEPGGR